MLRLRPLVKCAGLAALAGALTPWLVTAMARPVLGVDFFVVFLAYFGEAVILGRASYVGVRNHPGMLQLVAACALAWGMSWLMHVLIGRQAWSASLALEPIRVTAVIAGVLLAATARPAQEEDSPRTKTTPLRWAVEIVLGGVLAMVVLALLHRIEEVLFDLRWIPESFGDVVLLWPYALLFILILVVRRRFTSMHALGIGMLLGGILELLLVP